MEQGEHVIESVQELTVDFLRGVLKLPAILSFETLRIGTGQLGECYRVSLFYDGNPPADYSWPATIVLKIASRSPRSRASGVSLGIYEVETRFYLELAPSVAETTDCLANCYYSAFDGNTGAFTLILEDAGPTAQVGDDIKGALFGQAQTAVHELGKIHGSLMQDPERVAWLVKPLRISPEFFKLLFAGFGIRYKNRMDPSHFNICERLVASFKGYMERVMEPGSCTMGIMHGDYRLDNMLFVPRVDTRDKTRSSQNGLDLMVVDWQLMAGAPVANDLAYFLGGSLHTEDRRKWQNTLLQIYCDALDSVAGEPVLTVQDCVRDLRLNAFFGVVMGIVSSMMASQTERGDNMFMTMIARHCELVKDLNSMELLPEPEEEDATPLQPEAQDECQHEKGSEKDWNESWYFDFVDKVQGVAGWIRLGLVPNGRGNWYHAAISRIGEPTVMVVDFEAPSPDGELHLKTSSISATHTVLEPLKKFRLTLKGSGDALLEPNSIKSEKVPATLELDLLFETTGVPYRYRITPRYEIPCKVSGTLSIDSSPPINLKDIPGQRDHSFGSRDWWGMDWIWSAFHLDDGRHIHATELRLPNMPRVGMGYIQQGGIATEIRKLACEEDLDDTGLAVAMQMSIGMLDAADEISVTVAPYGHTFLQLISDDGRVSSFDRAWGDVTLSTGEKGVGWFEWNRNEEEEGQEKEKETGQLSK